MRVFLFDSERKVENRKALFILSRPFLTEKMTWEIDNTILEKFDLNANDFSLVNTISECQIVIIPHLINSYQGKKNHKLKALNDELILFNKKAYGFIGGDFGEEYKEFSNIVYFRNGGFRSKLSQLNKGFPVALSDHYERIFHKDEIIPLEKNSKPNVGFCGQASKSIKIQLKGYMIFLMENIKRFIKKLTIRNYEPFFSPSINRLKILESLTKSNLIKTNFILRKEYRAGAKSDEQREKTTLEYFENINQSDYVLCMRGAGNFSVRFYETLMFGKIPIFVNTDCILPFEDEIDWKQHVVWVEWRERKNIAQIVKKFHDTISNEAYKELQIQNRKLWKETLSVKGMFNLLKE